MSTWRDTLTPEQLHKVAPVLQQWLDGKDADELGLISGEPDTAKIYARLSEELDPSRVDEFLGLHLDAEPDMLVVPGVVTREQLLEIIRHTDVIAVNPVGRSQPTNPTAQRGPA
jgi:hypothetical protein